MSISDKGVSHVGSYNGKKQHSSCCWMGKAKHHFMKAKNRRSPANTNTSSGTRKCSPHVNWMEARGAKTGLQTEKVAFGFFARNDKYVECLLSELNRSSLCTLVLILDDSDLDSIVDGYLDLEMVEFTLHDVLIASFSQVMAKSNAKGIRIDEVEDHVRAGILDGDNLRLQQILADFLSISTSFTPSGGQVVVAASLTKHQLGKSVQLASLELSITHAGSGVTEQKHCWTRCLEVMDKNRRRVLAFS
ncbi:hypothetical protein K1719_024715 [Acacia pycnantha]|nr:hypothetical protein K1719_024715 [Acacia pycnantha]